MLACTWSATLVLIYFSQYLVLSEIRNNDEETNSFFNHTSQEITKIINTITNALSHSSARNMGYINWDNLKNIQKTYEHLGPRITKQVQLILDGIKLRVVNETKDNKFITAENMAHEVNVSVSNNQRKLVTAISNKIKSLIEEELNINKSYERKFIKWVDESEVLTHNLESNSSRRMFEVESESESHYLGKADIIDKKISDHKTLNERTITQCHYFINSTCEDIKNMNRLKCRYEHRYIKLYELCDGKPDCLFESDEKNCATQVMEQFLYVKQVEANIESSRYSKCLEIDASRSVLANQAKTLQKVLEKELHFRMKYKYLNSSFHDKNNTDNKYQMDKKLEEKQENMANNIALVISSLALALDGAICANKLDNLDTRRINALFDIGIDKKFKESLTPSNGCKCKKEFCINCTHYCKRICKQKYSLNMWNCESVNGTSMVSLNLLCDGKFDCFDKSDENGCDQDYAETKQEAREMYSKTFNMLQLKALEQRQPIHKEFLLLSDSIIKLQELTTKPVPTLTTIKKLRDKCYSMLRTIYSDIVKSSDIGKESEEAYLFLLSINRNLGAALKHSHTGNTKVMGNKCVCKSGICALSFCSTICTKVCAIEPRLTRYYCIEKSNKSVSMEKICDGVKDCHNGYDEFDCRNDEICRRHHLVILRHNLQRVGENLKGTALGELLSSWKLKVISTLMIFERTERPTPQALKNVADNILKDLVATYGSVEKYRKRTTDYILEVFLNISQIILESIKSCRK